LEDHVDNDFESAKRLVKATILVTVTKPPRERATCRFEREFAATKA
jgi:hypothetical protein